MRKLNLKNYKLVHTFANGIIFDEWCKKEGLYYDNGNIFQIFGKKYGALKLSKKIAEYWFDDYNNQKFEAQAIFVAKKLEVK